MRLIDADELIEIIEGSEELLDFQKEELLVCVDACCVIRDRYNKAIDDFAKKIQSRKGYFEEYYPKDSIAISEANVYLEIANELKHLNQTLEEKMNL